KRFSKLRTRSPIVRRPSSSTSTLAMISRSSKLWPMSGKTSCGSSLRWRRFHSSRMACFQSATVSTPLAQQPAFQEPNLKQAHGRIADLREIHRAFAAHAIDEDRRSLADTKATIVQVHEDLAERDEALAVRPTGITDDSRGRQRVKAISIRVVDDRYTKDGTGEDVRGFRKGAAGARPVVDLALRKVAACYQEVEVAFTS